MSDPVPPPAPATPPAPDLPAAGATPATKPVKKPGPIRWWMLITLVVLIGAAVLTVPFVIEPWLRGQVDAALKDRGLKLADDSKLSLSLFGGQITSSDLRLVDITVPAPHPVAASATRLNADVDVRGSLATFDLILEEVAIEGMTGSLRRRADGTSPGSTPSEDGTDWSKVDWAKWYEKAMEQWKARKEAEEKEQQEEQRRREEEAKKPPGERQPIPDHPYEADPDWPKATEYKPLRREGRKYPRVLVRKLSITGSEVALPDESPFDVQSFTLTGTDVALDQDTGETMRLNAKVQTKGAGEVVLDLDRTPDNGGLGNLRFAAEKVPLAVLNDPRIAGPEYAKYGASGDAKVSLAQSWKGWDLTGTLESLVTGLQLQPKPDAGGQAQQVATYVNQLKGQPIKWPVQLGGTIFSPRITDSGVKQVLSGSAVDAAKGILGDKATQEANKLIEGQADKNPEVKQATEGLKGLFEKKK